MSYAIYAWCIQAVVPPSYYPLEKFCIAQQQQQIIFFQLFFYVITPIKKPVIFRQNQFDKISQENNIYSFYKYSIANSSYLGPGRFVVVNLEMLMFTRFFLQRGNLDCVDCRNLFFFFLFNCCRQRNYYFYY
eukprot:TRINITY_DN11919_c1_g2_i1.p3 TRINITY_DN11919_c1_g2~~TRINITY_DN11919_c1_g2_i1.p3  ORF type:complete len:132 (+),score=0.91 TRINITY_DN11919_c1_g2_i1:131-526(+)